MEKLKMIFHFSLSAPFWLFLCDVFRNSRKRMMIPTWIHSGQTDKLWGNSFKGSPTSNGGPDDSHVQQVCFVSVETLNFNMSHQLPWRTRYQYFMLVGNWTKQPMQKQKQLHLVSYELQASVPSIKSFILSCCLPLLPLYRIEVLFYMCSICWPLCCCWKNCLLNVRCVQELNGLKPAVIFG